MQTDLSSTNSDSPLTTYAPPSQSSAIVSAAAIRDRLARVQEIVETCMVNGTDYGIIPGCQKPSLWQPGAEKLAFAFGIFGKTRITDMSAGRRIAYRVECDGYHAGQCVGTGCGEASSDEEKWAWRAPTNEDEWNSAAETDRREKQYRNGGTQRQVRTNPETIRNTILRMADKRAFVAMVRRCTGTSGMFTDLIERDEASAFGGRKTYRRPQASAPQQAPAPPSQGGGQDAQPPSGVRLVNDKQRKLFWARAKSVGMSDEQIRDYLLGRIGTDSTSNIPANQLDAMLEEIAAIGITLQNPQ